MLRIITRRVVDMAEEGKGPDEILEFYNFIALTTMRLSSLLRTQKLLEKSENTSDTLLSALEKVIKKPLPKVKREDKPAGLLRRGMIRWMKIANLHAGLIAERLRRAVDLLDSRYSRLESDQAHRSQLIAQRTRSP